VGTTALAVLLQGGDSAIGCEDNGCGQAATVLLMHPLKEVSQIIIFGAIATPSKPSIGTLSAGASIAYKIPATYWTTTTSLYEGHACMHAQAGHLSLKHVLMD
jgi:hypothetical protein